MRQRFLIGLLDGTSVLARFFVLTSMPKTSDIFFWTDIDNPFSDLVLTNGTTRDVTRFHPKSNEFTLRGLILLFIAQIVDALIRLISNIYESATLSSDYFFLIFFMDFFLLENKVTKPWFDREIKPNPRQFNLKETKIYKLIQNTQYINNRKWRGGGGGGGVRCKI